MDDVNMKSHLSPALLFAIDELEISWQNIVRSFITNVLLPKKLPQEEEPYSEEISTVLLSLLASATKRFSSGEAASSTIPGTANTLAKWTTLQNKLRDEFTLNKALAQLQIGDTIPIYIRCQNCTIIFTKLDKGHMRLMTFRASLPNEVIMSTAGSLQVSYPETVEVVPISKLLLSPTFSKHIRKLSLQTCSLALPLSGKAGKQFPEKRQPSNPFIISEFMVGMLQPINPAEYNGAIKQRTSIKITKKIRDEVNWDDCTIPFRRSGLWMSAKVVLQLCLKEELGNDNEARLAYKIILLEMIIQICKEFVQLEPENWDIISQLMVKLARRARKLSELPNPTKRLEKERKLTLEHSFKTIDKLHSIVQTDWKQMQFTPSSEIESINLSEAEILTDIQHNMTALNEYLAKPRLPNESKDPQNLGELKIPRYLILSCLLESRPVGNDNSGDVHMNPKTVWIYDVEHFTRNHLNCNDSSSDVYNLFCAYTEAVVKLYAEEYSDPVSFSRMILTVLKMIRVMDEIACGKHSLLKKYNSGIDPNKFDNLLLPQKKEEMEMLESLMGYFSSRNQVAEHPYIIENRNISPSSFSVQFARHSKEMTELKEKILSDTEREIEKKHDEVQRARLECQTLQIKINAEECKYVWNSYFEVTQHSSSCHRCALKTELERIRKSVTYYQRPLPNNYMQEHLQDAVVFELEIPEEIAYLRNSLATFLGEICGVNLFDGLISENIYVTWFTFPDLILKYTASRAFQSTAVKLGSTRKSTMATHYGKDNPDVVLKKDEDFIVGNGLNCLFYFVPSLKFKRNENSLIFQLINSANHGPYAKLQPSMNTPSPSENQIIASQYQCYEKLKQLQVKEFIAFGSMRSGHRIQLRNLYLALSNQTISLEQESVLALILQSIWEVGPKNSNEEQREIHIDFYEEGFSLQFLGLLEKILKSNATNWSCPMVMFAVILLTIRILELNESHEVLQFCGKLLKLGRVTLEAWWVKLESIILNARGGGSEPTKDLEILNELMLQTAVCSAYTFNVNSEHLFQYVILEQDDIVFWLCTVSRMYHMVVREKAHKNFSKLLQNMVRDARLRIPLNIESYLHQMIEQSKNKYLHEYTSRQWPAAAKSGTGSSIWKCCAGTSQHVYEGIVDIHQASTFESHIVYVDSVRGIFLVDGYPPSYLPENIIQHELFNRFFKHCRFQVQRDSRTFTTINKYLDHHYQFYFTKDSELIVRQMADNNSYLELVPPLHLSKQVAKHFIEDFTHWYSSQSNQLEFRNRSEDIIEYYFCPEMKLLMEHGHNPRQIFSINSEAFKKIVKTLSRLEYEEFIDVSLEGGASQKMVVTANLRRLNLRFELKNAKLYSRNFPGYYIAPNQCFGTLVGLKNGFLLEKETIAETSGFKKLFLIQHGIIQIGSLTDRTHQSVTVDSTSLRKPPIFTFEVDQILNRLKAGNDKSAWLYLAALHASTSSPFPDEFTGLTGTEMAMWILQSGCIFSCSPYDEECLETFKMIHKLSPQRVYYPHHLEQMQTIKWPSGLEHNSYAAYDGFGILVDYLIHCSNRLEGLFPRTAKESDTGDDDEVETSPKLRERSYYSHLNNYNQVAHLKECFVKGHCYFLTVQISLNSMRSPSKEWMQLGKVRMDGKLHFNYNNSNVESLIMTSKPLPRHPELPPVHNGKKPTFSFGTLNDWFNNKLRKSWLHLYTLALQGEALEHEFTLILGALLYFQRGSLEQALNLHNISRLASTSTVYQFPSAVEFKTDFVPSSYSYAPVEIYQIVERAAKKFPDSQHQYDKHSLYLEAQKKFEKERDKQIALAACAPAAHWPSEEIQKWVFGNIVSEKYLDLEKIKEKVDQKFAFWYNNLKLKQFVNKVDQILDVVRNAAIMNVPSCHLQISSLQPQTVADDADKLGSVIADMKIVEGVPVSTKNTIETEEKSQRQLYVMKIGMIWECLHEYLHCTQISKALNDAGIHIRLAPVVLLRKLLEHETSKQDRKFNEQINELAICFTNLRRLNRILHYRTSDIYSVELERELASEPFENWDPLEHPEWLLLELELNVTIRPIQVDVAKHMMNMDGGGVTQLNMGEGKTSVIVPMIVSTLSARDDLVCRVTVLSSIFTTNFNLLTFTVGGLLNKRLYSVPCRRDYKISQFLPQIEETYLECMKLTGVIMTLPEYRLSFRLMMYNYYLQEKHDFALQVYNIEKWIREHVRDIVDESDEIFSVKYQLIYTSGKQQKLGGGNLRWIVCQKLLQILPDITIELFDQFGEKAVEFSKDDSVANPEQFTAFRILSNECKKNLHDLIVNALLQGKIDLITIILTEEEKELVKAFLTDENISEEYHNAVLKMNGIEEEMKTVLLIISGYLRHGVLLTALTKRWRVECGVNDKGEKLMAVPFRAKDVAAERTEFGHPDMAIVLTQLSYYYSGLNDEQLMETFSKLKKMAGPESLYNGWIQKIPQAKVHDSIRTYKGINLLDFEQRTKHLFPVLRKHKAVIDFWLENCVYPKESKQFPRKLVMNAWDLSYEKQIHPTTGFSGTNDTQLLLPATISQKDLDELQKTNEQLEATLQRPENGWRRSLAMATTCKNILKNMKEDGLRVLIDAGALILDGNEDVANLWLQVDEALEGVVYFNGGGELVIKTRSGSDAQLKLSSYNDRLEQCAVYLDDYHTRGTDLKLPNNFKACVTIGSRMRRDKLMQACMRMRKLGRGQSVHFYLSHEANNKILEMMNTYGNNVNHFVTNEDILAWTKLNSSEFEKEGLVYWAASAKNYTQKLAADEMFEMSDKSGNEGELLAKRCEDKEMLSLEEIYGTYRSKQKLVDIIPRWFLHVEQKLKAATVADDNDDTAFFALPDDVQKLINHYAVVVQNQCEKNIPSQTFLYSMLDEEQEKELEPEQEEEVNDEGPPEEEATAPKLHQNVENFIRLGGTLYVKPGILKLSEIFKHTTFWSKIQPEGWGSQLYATEDFVNVILNPSGGDSFLRPMSYIASWAPSSSNPLTTSVLLLSPYEVNELMPLFHSKNQTTGTLHMFSGRYMEGQDTLVNQTRLQLPVSQRGALLSEEMMAPLLIAAGNLFYASMKEQKAFAQFLGLHPRPWQTEDQEAFENGLITGTGFVLPNNSTTMALRQHSLFQQDPTVMVRTILNCRNDVLRDTDHTIQLLNQRAYIEEIEEDED